MGPDTRLRCFLPKDRLSSLSSLFWWADCYYFLSTGEIKCLVHFGAVGSAGEEFSFSIFYWLRRRSSDQDFYFYSGRLPRASLWVFEKNLTSENFSLSFIYLAPEIWSDHAKMCKNTSLTRHTSSTSSSTHQAVGQKLHSHSVVITASAAPATKSTDQSNTVLPLQTGRINPPELWEAARKAQTPADNLRWPPLLAVAASDPLPPPAGSGGCRPIRERLGARGAFRR